MHEEFNSLSITASGINFGNNLFATILRITVNKLERDFRTICILKQYEVLEDVSKNYFFVRGMITDLRKEKTYYQVFLTVYIKFAYLLIKACADVTCRKKKLSDLCGQLRCEKCNKYFTSNTCLYVPMLQVYFN
jgi:hypothetical protein